MVMAVNCAQKAGIAPGKRVATWETGQNKLNNIFPEQLSKCYPIHLWSYMEL